MQRRVLDVITELERFMQTVDDALPLSRESAEFVHVLLLGSQAVTAVEIGTSYGYSGLWIASALTENQGRLITIDHMPHKTDAARDNFRKAGLARSVEVWTGEALDLVPSIEGPIDFVLNDADKENCMRYVELLADKLRDRAVVITDNTTSHRSELAEFVQWVRRHPGFESSGLNIGNGLEMSVKLPRSPSRS